MKLYDAYKRSLRIGGNGDVLLEGVRYKLFRDPITVYGNVYYLMFMTDDGTAILPYSKWLRTDFEAYNPRRS